MKNFIEANMEKYGMNLKKLIYENKFEKYEDVENFVMEGDGKVSFPNGKMLFQNSDESEEGLKATYVFWCPVDFPENILAEWKFLPLREPGLSILFFSAVGNNGKDIFDKSLEKRTGKYPQYHHGDINAFHISYFRRKKAEERNFHTCNLRKSYGFHLTAQGADPIPDVEDVSGEYTCCFFKKGNIIKFFINGLEIFSFEDDGKTYGPLLKGGKIGFRQMAPLIAEYSDFKVYEI